jgi:acrylyl-CoA reductase (NADPH)
MVCGIDLAGTVVESKDARFKPGDKVYAIGRGLADTMWGGYSQMQRVNPDILTKVPAPFSEKQVMSIGTAGYTAILSVLALEEAGLKPGQGDVVVTGAAGGVGSMAVAILAKLGYRVVASTGRKELHDYLKSLGAAEIIGRDQLDKPPIFPFDNMRWAGAIDTVGGRPLATVISQMKFQTGVAICGLANNAELHTSVSPFILRGVRMLGINYFQASQKHHDIAWKRLGSDLDPAKIDLMTQVEPMSKLTVLADKILGGNVRGRTVIDVNA